MIFTYNPKFMKCMYPSHVLKPHTCHFAFTKSNIGSCLANQKKPKEEFCFYQKGPKAKAVSACSAAAVRGWGTAQRGARELLPQEPPQHQPQSELLREHLRFLTTDCASLSESVLRNPKSLRARSVLPLVQNRVRGSVSMATNEIKTVCVLNLGLGTRNSFPCKLM